MKAISILSFTACFLFGGSAIADEMSLIYKFKDWEIRTNGQTLIFGTEGNGKTFSFFGFVTKKVVWFNQRITFKFCTPRILSFIWFHRKMIQIINQKYSKKYYTNGGGSIVVVPHILVL